MKDKIVIFIIDNTGHWPSYFAMDIVNLYLTTVQKYPNTVLKLSEQCNIEAMRNYACRYAMGLKKMLPDEKPERADFLVMIDSDHIYRPDFIVNLMKHKKNIITGCTSRRVAPFGQTQYKEVKTDIRAGENEINPNIDEPIMKIGASGPVGMLIKVDVLFKLEYPYYVREYVGTKENIEAYMGSDIYFSKQLKKIGINIWLDPSISFPHEVRRVFVNRGQLKL